MLACGTQACQCVITGWRECTLTGHFRPPLFCGLVLLAEDCLQFFIGLQLHQ